jgi:Flp pilus assembly protein TadD
MPLDLYQPCPGGTNKKIKFCGCDRDILGDLNKIVDSLEGDQRAAALGHADRALEAFGPRACLLALKGSAQLHMNDLEGLAKTAETFQQLHPQNPVALSMSAVVSTVQGDTDTAVAQLQRALEQAGGNLPGMTYLALGLVGQMLLRQEDFLAAFGHLSLQVNCGREKAKQATELLLRLNASPSIPLLLKRDMQLDAAVSAAVPRAALEEALTLAGQGCWAKAAEHFAALAEKHPREPALAKNLAILYGWLAREDDAGTWWRKYAAMDGVDLDSAVEAEALAQLVLFSEVDDHQLDEVTQTYHVADTDRVMERLLSEKCVTTMPVDLTQMATDESPPPKGAFWLLDRDATVAANGLQHHDIPNIVGELYLFGRQTDREARLEFVATKTTDFEAKLQAVQNLIGEFGSGLQKEETTGRVSVTTAALTWRWRLPPDVTPDQREALIQEKRRDVHLNVWPQTPMQELDGKSPAAAVADPALRVRVLAAILLLELTSEQSRGQFDFNEMRAKLGLPLRQDLELTEIKVGQLSPVNLSRLPAEQLSDEALLTAFRLAVMYHASRGLRRHGFEVVRRESLRGTVDLGQIYDVLMTVARDADEALEFNAQGRQASVALGRSPAKWLIEELHLRLVRGEAEAAQRIFNRIQTNHIREPGVAQALHSLLVQLGLITPDGRPAAEAARGPAAPAASVPPPAGKIWTPGSDAPAPVGEKKPNLWVPGM